MQENPVGSGRALRIENGRTAVLTAMLVAILVAVVLAVAASRAAEAAFPGTDGMIIFSSDRARAAQDIFAISPAGGATDRLTTFSTGHNTDPAVSPDGSRIAFAHDGQIWVMKASGMGTGGTGAARITSTPTAKMRPAWSPDGTRIAFVANSADVDGQMDLEIWAINADGSGQTQLTNNTVPDDQPAWSPDGTRIAFVGTRTGDTNRNIYLMDTNPATEDAINLTQNSATPSYQGHDDHPSWSPDGSQITYTNNGEGGDADVFKMDADPATKDWTNLTSNPSEDTEPAWSPDGTGITYRGTTSDFPDRNIYVMGSDGSSPVRIDTNTAHDISPDWQAAAPACDIEDTAGTNVLNGTPADETICGLGGNDAINGGGGNDLLIGGEGNDTLVIPAGKATLDGGAGTDTASFAGSATPIQASLTSDFARRTGTDPLEGVALLNVENLTGSGFGDELSGDGAANRLVGGAGADELLGLAGKDRLDSRDGVNRNDSLNGGKDTDRCLTDNREAEIKGCE